MAACAAFASVLWMARNSMIGKAEGGYPIGPVDRRINELGAEQNLKSIQDARLLVEALLARFQIDGTELPGLSGFASRLAEAEYAAVRDPGRRTSEGSVGGAFNLLMDRMGMPESTRISADEVHAFRVAMCLTLYPSWVTRQSDGDLPATVRPVEAAYLVYLLYTNGGVARNARRAILEKGLPRPDPSVASPPDSFRLRAVRISPEEFQRRREYSGFKSQYMATHTSSDAAAMLEDFFALIGVK
jgi:hypothetical protein